MDGFKTPKGKLCLVINFAKTISVMLSETNTKGEADGADLFFPLQIFCLFQCDKVDALKSNINYIRSFR